MKMNNIWLTATLILTLCNTLFGSAPHRRFEYKLSFKGPHLVQRDGTIPFWEHGGHAIASEESVRITPSLRSKKGYVWSKEKNVSPNWEVEVVFRISGRGRIGADGLAFWYTKEKGTEGYVFGSNDRWNGLAVFFDSFDNDGQHNNPYIMAMVNDGTLNYDHNSDGSSQQLGGCLRDFRNKPFPIRVKIEYYQKALSVFFHGGMTNNVQDYELCLRVENVELPPSGHFGISGATGGLADDHDVFNFLTHSLHPPSETPDASKQVSEEDKKKFEKEYEDYRNRLDKAKEDYRKQHPDQKPPPNQEEGEYFESQDIRELKMIFDGQNSIHETMRQLHRKLDEMIGRQERTLSQISMISQGGAPPAQGVPQGQPHQQLPQIDTIRRHEVDTVMQQQREVGQHVRDIRSFVNDVQSKVLTIQQQLGSGGGGYDQQKQQQIQNSLGTLQNDVRTLVNKQGSAGSCPPAPSCVSTSVFIVLILIQTVLFLGYNMYRSNKEAAAKKFY